MEITFRITEMNSVVSLFNIKLYIYVLINFYIFLINMYWFFLLFLIYHYAYFHFNLKFKIVYFTYSVIYRISINYLSNSNLYRINGKYFLQATYMYDASKKKLVFLLFLFPYDSQFDVKLLNHNRFKLLLLYVVFVYLPFCFV